MNALALQIYKLKQEYGRPIAIYHIIAGEVDPRTGSRVTMRIKYEIESAVVVPNKFETVALYTAPYVKAARQFAFGNYTDVDVKSILLDTEDFPDDITLMPEDYVVISHEKYQFIGVTEYEDGPDHKIGYLLTVKRLPGEEVNEVHEIQIFEQVRFTERCVNG